MISTVIPISLEAIFSPSLYLLIYFLREGGMWGYGKAEREKENAKQAPRLPQSLTWGYISQP